VTILKNANQAMTEDAYKQQFLAGILSYDMQAACKTALAHAGMWSLDTIINFMRTSFLRDKAVKTMGQQRDRRFAFAGRGRGQGPNRGQGRPQQQAQGQAQPRAQGRGLGRGQNRAQFRQYRRNFQGPGRGQGRYVNNRNNWNNRRQPYEQNNIIPDEEEEQPRNANNINHQQEYDHQDDNAPNLQHQAPLNPQPGERFYRANKGEPKKKN